MMTPSRIAARLMSAPEQLHIRVGCATHVGLKKLNNEDCLLCSSEHGLFILADGMGGHQAGEVASQLAVETIFGALTEDAVGSRSHAMLRTAVLRANQTIYEAASNNPDQRGMGTTTVVLSLHDNEALAATVGDSRLYKLRGEHIRQVNRDHTLYEQERKAGRNPDRQRTGHILTKCVGYHPVVEVDTFRFRMATGDALLLCSDGLSDVTDDRTILGVCQSQPDPGEAAQELVRIANEHGGPDNISVIIVRIEQAPRSRWRRLLTLDR